MNNRIIEYILERMAFLKDHGFNQSLVEELELISNVYFFSDDTAIQFELDWRELAVFCMIVNLNCDGDLPQGYYMTDNVVCRTHLKTYIIENNLLCDKNHVQAVSNLGKFKTKNRDENFMMSTITLYQKLLEECVMQIVSVKK